MNPADYRRTLCARQSSARAQYVQRSQAVLAAEDNLRTARALAAQTRGLVAGLTQAIADLDTHASIVSPPLSVASKPDAVAPGKPSPQPSS